jgi:putative colanic acid biosysnthesis UDP-glucose lipid carrier transferase
MADRATFFGNLETRSERICAPASWDRVQRALDILLIVSASPVWIPVLLVTMTLKMLIDGRPVLFHHLRSGKNGEPLMLHKIRTTPRDFTPGPRDWTTAGFPPRTRLGRWLRRVDLDELPQLWNVLKGEMSLVGPRPEMPYHSETFSQRIPGYAQRLAVRPGLTGLAQIRGWRANTSIEHRLRSDLEYIGSRGSLMYAGVLFATIGLEIRRVFAKSSLQHGRANIPNFHKR